MIGSVNVKPIFLNLKKKLGGLRNGIAWSG